MTLKKRYRRAQTAKLTITGKIVRVLLYIIITIVPYLLWRPDDVILKYTFSNLEFWALLFAGSIMVWSIIFMSFIVFLLLIALIEASITYFIEGIFTEHRAGTALCDTVNFIYVLYYIVFGDYKDKWFFIKEWFQPSKVALEMLEMKSDM